MNVLNKRQNETVKQKIKAINYQINIHYGSPLKIKI